MAIQHPLLFWSVTILSKTTTKCLRRYSKVFTEQFNQITLFLESFKCADCTFCQGWLFGLSICVGNLTPPNGLWDSYGDSLYHCLTHQPYYCPTIPHQSLLLPHCPKMPSPPSAPLIWVANQHFPNTCIIWLPLAEYCTMISFGNFNMRGMQIDSSC